uniref:NAD(P)(+)--arginine ADP-ribosyltransferase n=2 Tax=Dicentrarchus labrax TaxID=13489 RepID=A0A8C4HC15_DICLA
MKGNMMIFASLCLLLFCMVPVNSKPIRSTPQVANPIALDMAVNSVDDMNFGCTETMMDKVTKEYFQKERAAWQMDTDVNRCIEKNSKAKALTRYHIEAICAYTSDRVYKSFNEEVRTKRGDYGSSFQFHSLHFLLTSAIQISNNNYYCQTVYRRTRVEFTGEVNQIIRFGQFASSSLKTNLVNFGKKTCFKIETCSGAFLGNYSVFSHEAEVLIPPYEMFNITEKITDQSEVKMQGLEDCEVVYVLKSVGGKSNLNCKVVNLMRVQ